MFFLAWQPLWQRFQPGKGSGVKSFIKYYGDNDDYVTTIVPWCCLMATHIDMQNDLNTFIHTLKQMLQDAIMASENKAEIYWKDIFLRFFFDLGFGLALLLDGVFLLGVFRGFAARFSLLWTVSWNTKQNFIKHFCLQPPSQGFSKDPWYEDVLFVI
jgi:hypothetical protein